MEQWREEVRKQGRKKRDREGPRKTGKELCRERSRAESGGR